MNRMARVIKQGLLATLVSVPVWADDTDIYLNNGATDIGVTRVMLTLDFRSNVGSTNCNDAASATCKTLMGDQLYPVMDLYGLDGSRGADGFPDKTQEDPSNPGNKISDTYWSGTKTNLYDTLRTVYRVVIEKIAVQANNPTSELGGIEIGFMVAHEGDCKGAGPDQLPGPGGKSGCSQGAYVLQAFTDIRDELDRRELYIKMAAIPEPGIREHWMANAWNGHTYKVRDMYLELYRYITGKAVFNGYLGYSDYNSQKSAGNLYEKEPENDVVFDIDIDGKVDKTYDSMWLQPDTDAMDSFDPSTDALSSAKYKTPLDAGDSCSAFYMINALFGDTGNSDRDTDTAIGQPVSQQGMNVSLSGGQDTKDAQIVAAMYGTDWGDPAYGLPDIAGTQNVTTYVISDKVRKNTNDMAFAGGTGTAFALSNPQAALEALESIFEEILSVSTTFVAASVPTNVFDRASAVDNIYFALFQAEKEPWWGGNVKKLRIAELEITDPSSPFVGETIRVIAQAPLTNPPQTAISAVDGRIKNDALTFWTNPLGEDVSPPSCTDGEAPLEEEEVCGKDGRSITRGGAGQQIPGYLNDSIGVDNDTGSRKVWTENPVTGAALPLAVNMDLTTGLSSALDPNDTLDEATERKVIGWIRGMDTFNADATKTSDSRPWLMADPMHSRPLVVNYGKREGTTYSKTNPDIRLFFGTNDGMVRFVRNTLQNGTDSGEETAAFIPLEMLGIQYTLAQNMAQLAPPHPYGMDGEAVSYVYDANNDGNITPSEGDYVWAFIGQRRGGTGLYAFDLTDPDNPVFKWKINNTTAGFEQLALTFSTPQAVRMDLGDALGTDDGDDNTPVLIFAGGYNGGWSGNSRVGKNAGDGEDTVGNSIYIVNADTGALIWKAVGPDDDPDTPCSDSQTNFCVDGQSDAEYSSSRPSLVDSIPSTMAVVDSDNNNIIDRAYVGDSGGNVWRVELTEDQYKIGDTLRDEDNWYVTKLGQFGGTGADDRRFFHAPDYVKALETGTKNAYDGIIITSGDRAAPRETTVENYAFMMKDTLTGTNGSPSIKTRPPFVVQNPGDSNPTGLTDITNICIDGSSTEVACSEADLTNGWKLNLEANGEKGLSSPLVANGVVLFTTYLPNDQTAASLCAPSEGSGLVYLVSLSDGSAEFDLAAEINVWTKQDRFSNVGAGIPGDVIPYEDQVLIPGKGIGGRQIYDIPGRNLWRVYWREEGVDQ